MIKVLVTGSSGQLGQCLQKIGPSFSELEFCYLSSKACDITSIESVNEQILSFKPHYIINCAAYTAVDRAEQEEDIAHAINVEGPRNLAQVCATHQITLIHISTDFVFKGEQVKLLTEEDSTEPTSVYGRTKLSGEAVIQSLLKQHIIVRTSWLYSEYGSNFFKTMLKLGAEREKLNVVADQVGTPTYSIDLANALCQIILSQEKTYGIFHFSNEGVTSWYDFTQSIFALAKYSSKVQPIPSKEYPTPAKRPAFSVLEKHKIKLAYALEIDHWQFALQRCFASYNSNRA